MYTNGRDENIMLPYRHWLAQHVAQIGCFRLTAFEDRDIAGINRFILRPSVSKVRIPSVIATKELTPVATVELSTYRRDTQPHLCTPFAID